MNLASPPDKYDRTDQANMRAALTREDKSNQKRGGDHEIGSGRLILTSPNGTRYAVVVNNAGALSTTAV